MKLEILYLSASEKCFAKQSFAIHIIYASFKVYLFAAPSGKKVRGKHLWETIDLQQPFIVL